MSELNKHVGKVIPKEEANKLKERWAEAGHKTKSSFFGSDIIQKLLNVPNAIGLRIHYGIDKNGNMSPILNAELDVSVSKTAADGDGDDVDASYPCPPYCTP